MTAVMTQKAIAPWAGAKRNLARHIVPLIGKHGAYWEPFCGGMSILLAKPPCRVEVVNDLHGDLTNLARIIKDRTLGPMLYRRLRRVLFSEQLHSEANDALKDETDPLDRAFFYFIKAWMSWGGVAGSKRAGRKMSIRYTNNGGHQAKRFETAVASIPAWRRRLRNVAIRNANAFTILPNIEDAEGVVIYVDPPYIENSMDYEHELLPSDHCTLALMLNRFKRARIILSYYAHPILADLYPDWQQIEIRVTKAIAQIGKRESYRQRATEVLLLNDRHNQHTLF